MAGVVSALFEFGVDAGVGLLCLYALYAGLVTAWISLKHIFRNDS